MIHHRIGRQSGPARLDLTMGNPSIPEHFDVIVAGAGAGGICAALAAARAGARVLLAEKTPNLGGTGVHSAVALICRFHGTDHRPINIGLHAELFPEVYRYSTCDSRPECPRLTYDEKELAATYQRLIARENRLTVRLRAGVAAVHRAGRRIAALTLDDNTVVTAPVYVDATADGNLAALAGCAWEKGRTGDGRLQSATLTFAVGNIDKTQLRVPEYRTRGGVDSLWAELTPLYQAAKARGETTNPKSHVVVFPYPDGERLLFNSNEILGVDPTEPGSVEAAHAVGRQLVDELMAILRAGHPAFANARVLEVFPRLGVREGRRVIGDYVLTERDCLSAARFDDMVAACAYEIDIHDPDGGETRMVRIPDPGYYHIPYRSLIARDADNLLLGSRCISGTHEAHSSYRVISGVTAIGQAAGAAAALAARLADGAVRTVRPTWIRHLLRQQIQFVEGPIELPPTPDGGFPKQSAPRKKIPSRTRGSCAKVFP
jgi:hypothetical protein